MRNLILSLSIVMLFNLANSQNWTFVSPDNVETAYDVVIGYGPNGAKFQFAHDTPSDALFFNMNNNAYNTIFSVRSKPDGTWFGLENPFGSELFKASTFGSNNSMFVHMPQADSRLIIGAYGNYLQGEGHKLVVKDGSAKIEGDLFSTGSIGIGTMSFVDGTDIYKLSVDGRVRAHAVKVYTDWADYVFEDTYRLPTLEEVEQYIKDHGHLKDIPSAEEVEKNGVELGEMNKLLLQKIEELTLYTIELKKELEELKSKID